MTTELPRNTEKNLAIWNSLYGSYQKGTIMPGTQYPNLRLVDFIRRWKASPAWPTDRRPRVLELGFGSIANMRMMAMEGCDVHGLEVTEDAVQPALKAIKMFDLEEHLSAAWFNGVTISDPDNSYDAIIGLQCVYNNLHQMEFADDCARLLRPGGVVFFSFFTTNHGYMQHIVGEPGGPVTFTDDHPNPRLPGLEVFLYRNAAQFEDVYGRHFDIDVDKYETDLLAVHQSWHYLRGQLKDRPADSGVRVPGSNPATASPSTYHPNSDEDSRRTQKNIDVLDQATILPLQSDKTILQEYPNVEIVRFLATWNRRQKKDYFRHIIGQEMKSTEVQGLEALEVNSMGPSHLLAMDGFKYMPSGVCLGEATLDAVSRVLNDAETDNQPVVKCWDGTSLPFESEKFDVTFSLTSNLACDQKAFVGEIARTVAESGEIFMAYVSPRAGVLTESECHDENFFELDRDHDELNRDGMILFIASDANLEELWSPYFDVTINHFEYGGLPTYLSYQVVTGTRNGVKV